MDRLDVLEERGELLQRIADGRGRSAHRFHDGAREALDRAALVRRALMIGAGDRRLSEADEEAAGA